MYYLIYKITNNVNNKIYIGKHQTENKNDDYMGSGMILKRAIEKYGLDKFTKEILFECNSLEEMNEKEAEIVDEEFIARLDTYNVKLGGQGGWDFCNKNLNIDYSQRSSNGTNKFRKLLQNVEYYNKHLQKMRKISQNKEWRNKVKQGIEEKILKDGYFNTPHKHTAESKAKISKANSIKQKGENNSNFGKCWIYNEDLKENKSIKKEDLNHWLENGWKKGRKMKF